MAAGYDFSKLQQVNYPQISIDSFYKPRPFLNEYKRYNCVFFKKVADLLIINLSLYISKYKAYSLTTKK